jgi:ubiquinol-cytochrome c reductase cytochrome c1 subunit
MKQWILTIITFMFMLPTFGWASGNVHLMKANNDITDKASLQEGAKLFVNYCMGCHSAKYMRFDRMGKDLGLTEEELKENLMFTADKVGELMNIAMLPKEGEKWFGVNPPDLSVTARSRGVDWVYTYLLTFYLDSARPLGVNNLMFKDVGMPHVMWERQGWQKLVHNEVTDAHGNKSEVAELELVDKDKMTPQQYQQQVDKYRQDVRNLVNFLDYLGEPAKLQRLSLGWKVILFLAFFAIFAFLLKHEYWRDVH